MRRLGMLLPVTLQLGSLILAQTEPRLFQTLPRRHLPFHLESTFALACGDVDGDGDEDLLTDTHLYLNEGGGIYSTASPQQAGFSGFRLALGDVDGDHDLDLVAASRNVGQNQLYLNDGRGWFTNVTSTHLPPVKDGTAAVVLEDVDGDQDLDLLVGNGSNWQNRLSLTETGTSI